MTKYLLAATAVALGAFAATAAETPVVVTGTPVPAAAPVMVGTPVVESMPAQTGRRGLFGRMRGRTTTPVMTTTTLPTVTTAPVMTTTTTSMAMPAPTATTVTAPATMPTPAVPGGIIVVGGTPATENVLVPAAYTEPATTNTTSSRRGLFGRLRNR